MPDHFYTNERNVQIVIYLMKAHGIKRVIASPGATNVTLVASLQQDPFFEMYSSVDERSAAYMACGMVSETGEPVALTCTGATASRDYAPGLTEAFYRKLPVLAITAAQSAERIGQNVPQALDRTEQMRDLCVLSVQAPPVESPADERQVALAVNRAMLELTRHGGGPVHINLVTRFDLNFTTRELPPAQVIRRTSYGEKLPEIPAGRVGVFVGAHRPWAAEDVAAVERFCDRYDAVVLCDHTSNYPGKHGVDAQLVCHQESYWSALRELRLLVDIGDISGAYLEVKAAEMWRVNPDGEIRQRGGSPISRVFEMSEHDFFSCYSAGEEAALTMPANEESDSEIQQSESKLSRDSFATSWQSENDRLLSEIPELPFSNLWIAQQITNKVPNGCVVYLGILNSLRAWNTFPMPKDVDVFANTGGFGIDGYVSSCIGSSLMNPDRPHVVVAGDLAFFYDMNSLGNRHVAPNLRILLVNNGVGTEFKNYNHPAAAFGDDADKYMAAAGHYGRQSKDLVRHYAQDLGFEYHAAETKEEFLVEVDCILSPEIGDRPILFEVFTDPADESEALRIVNNLESDSKTAAKKTIKGILGERGVRTVKKMLRREA